MRILIPIAICLTPLAPLALRSFAAPRAQERDERDEGQDDDGDDDDHEAAGDEGREPLPELEKIARTGAIGTPTEPRSSPLLIARPDGRTTLGCIAWSPSAGDFLEVHDGESGLAPDGSATARRVRRVNDAPLEIVRPSAAIDASGRLHLLWSQNSGGRAQIAWSREHEGGFTVPKLLTTGRTPHLHPDAVAGAPGDASAGASDGPVLWLAFESDVAASPGARPDRDVQLAPLSEDGVLGPPVRVGDGRFSDVEPAIARCNGKLWIAWSSFSGENYEVLLRSFDPTTRELGPIRNVSGDSPSDDLHPCLIASERGELWLAWDRVEIAQRGTSAPHELRVIPCFDHIDVTLQCVCIRDGEVLALPAEDDERPGGVVRSGLPMSTGGGRPRLAFDRDGRLWIAYRYLRWPGGRSRTSFPLVVQWLGESGWSTPREIADSSGVLETPALVRAADGVLAAFYSDRRAEGDAKREMPPAIATAMAARAVSPGCWYGSSAIGLALAATSEPTTLPTLEPRAAAKRRMRGRLPDHVPTDPIQTGEEHFTIERGSDRWTVWWGDLHRHSSISRCSEGLEPAPNDRWTWGRDVGRCDFMALTDHSSHVEPLAWWQEDKLLWMHESDRFCTLAGFEWSTGRWGHHNVILRGRLAPFVDSSRPLESLYRALPLGEAITIPHHAAHPRYTVPFEQCEDDPSRLLEVYQAMRGNYEFNGCLKQARTAQVLGSFARDALQQGREFGFIASTDHRFGQSYACVLATRLERTTIFDALHARRTYGATAKGIFLDFRVDDAVMGEKVELDGPPTIRVVARGTDELAEVSVIKSGRIFKAVGNRSEEPNTFAPLRLVARVGPETKVASGFVLEVRSPGTRFAAVIDRRPFATAAEAGRHPRWSVDGATATLRCPPLDRPLPSSRVTVNAFVSKKARFQVVAPGIDVEIELAELMRAPATLRSAELGELRLEVAIGDATIDLKEGLGTKTFEREWIDDAPERGATWYYARVVQVDGEMAWSSPIFCTRR